MHELVTTNRRPDQNHYDRHRDDAASILFSLHHSKNTSSQLSQTEGARAR